MRPVYEVTFRPEHAIEAMLFVLHQLGGQTDTHSLLKAIYFGDLHHIQHFGGLPASGDDVRALQWGPAPQGCYDLVHAAEGGSNEYVPETYRDVVKGAISVRRERDSTGALIPYVTALRIPDLDLIAEAERQSLRQGADRVRGLSFFQKVDASHDAAWKAAWERKSSGRGDAHMRLDEMIAQLPHADEILEHVYAE